MALEMQEQIAKLLLFEDEESETGDGSDMDQKRKKKQNNLDAIIAPCGGGGMLSGIATALYGTGIRVFGAEPSFQGADDARRGVAAGSRIDAVKTLTIADGLRTPLGQHTWSVISDPTFVHGLYAVTEQNIKDAMKLVLERMKCFVEPSAVVGLATVLYNEEFRSMVQREAGKEGWNIGVVLSGGNTTVEAIDKIFGQVVDRKRKREEEGDEGRHGQRDGQRDGERDDQRNGQRDGHKDGHKDGQRNGQTHGQRDRQTRGWTDIKREEGIRVHHPERTQNVSP